MTYHFELTNYEFFKSLKPVPGMLVREESSEYRHLRVLDNVEWSIWLSGRVLIATDSNRMELVAADDTCQASGDVKRTPPPAEALPEPLAAEVKNLVSVRALILQFNCQWWERSLAFLNADDKIVARATIYHIENSPAAAQVFLTLHPLRGYDQEAQAIIKSLGPIATVTPAEVTLRFLLERCGLTPTPLVTRPEFYLKGQQPAEEAVLMMVAELLRLARQQEKGLIADIDTEFTHQYRVNLRKARSLLSLFKKELSPQRYRAVQVPLKTMAKATNQLRDLDVFLLGQDDYRAMLPANFQPGLDDLFKRLKHHRRQIWRNVTATLKKKEYLEITQQLEKKLKEPPDFSAPHSRTAIRERASRKILAQYRKIQRHGTQIDAATADEQVHELRIEAKKLRYLLELFGELFSYDRVRRLIKALKKLQDNLGRFNDYSSQCLFLEPLLHSAGIKIAERDAISGLIAVLYNKQKKEREQVVEMIAAFSGTGIAEQFQQLFFAPAAKESGS